MRIREEETTKNWNRAEQGRQTTKIRTLRLLKVQVKMVAKISKFHSQNHFILRLNQISFIVLNAP